MSEHDEYKRILNGIASELRENNSLPVVLTTSYVTDAEVEAECLEWVLQFNRARSKNKRIPSHICSALARATASRIVKSDLTVYHEQRCQDDEVPQTLINTEKLAAMTFETLAEICDSWSTDLPKVATLRPRLDIFMCAIKNTRRKMEDKHAILPEFNSLFGLEGQPIQSFFGVYDGHNGVEAAEYAAAHLHRNIIRHKSFPDDMHTAIREGFLQTDDAFCERARREANKSGSTAVIALLQNDMLHVAWLGDSQLVIVRNDSAISVTKPHKPDDPEEKQRIESQGGCVVWLGTWRVNGMLSLSRAIGDANFKPHISGEPGIESLHLDGTEDYFVLACDGLWDVLEPHDLPKLVSDHMDSTSDNRSTVAETLVKYARGEGSADNISVVVVFFNHASKKS